MTRKIFVSILTHNDYDRYLLPVLKAAEEVCDEIFVFDDDSDDLTVTLAKGMGATVAVASDRGDASFLSDESDFRSASYEALRDMTDIKEGDWVLSLDSDEMLAVTKSEYDPSTILGLLADEAEADGFQSVPLHVSEVFKLVEDTPYVRVDGYWNQNYPARFFRWSGNCDTPRGIMGGGSIPEVAAKSQSYPPSGVGILHYGYAREEDRIARYARYQGCRGRHNPVHIDSILRNPTLVKWQGPHLALEHHEI